MAEKRVEPFQPSPRPSTETEQERLRHSIARALAFVMPGLGHAFHGAIVWAVGYAAVFWFSLYRFWVSLTVHQLNRLSYLFGGKNEAPAYVGWIGLAVIVWLAQLIHVTMMETD